MNYRLLARLLVVTTLILALGGCAWMKARFGNADSDAVGESTTPAAAAAADAGPVDAAEAGPATEGAALAPSQSPGVVADDFYTMHARLGSSGLPNVGAANAYNAFVCPSLASLMESAREAQQRYRRERPGDKAPLTDGDLFSSLFEGPDAVTATDTDIDGDTAEVSLSMRQGAGESSRRWTDTVILSLDDGAWCIADVEYGGDWAEANRGRLSDKLRLDP